MTQVGGADGVLSLEGFETIFPGSTWTSTDADSTRGTDSWGATTARAHTGNRSVWSAAVGNRSGSFDVLSDDFEGIGAGSDWIIGDADLNYGEDYWGLSSAQVRSGSYSFWSAQVGSNGEYSDYYTNEELGLYDSYMNASMTHAVDLSGFVSATFEFWYMLDAEPDYDYFWIVYFDGGWNYVSPRDGNSNGWVKDSLALPSGTSAVGFMFTTDSTVTYGGVYVDSVRVYGTQLQSNTATRLYDDGMDAMLSRAVDASGYESARVEYQYWTQVEGVGDYLEAGYFAGAWTFVNRHDGTSGGWTAGTYEFPLRATRIGFRFVSDASGRAEGAYLDDVRVVGHVSELTCGASADKTAGIEGVTSFALAASVGGGLRPLVWAWAFGDGSVASSAGATHTFGEVGVYTPSLTVADALGQTCAAEAPAITVDHDLSSVIMSPASGTVSEGGSLVVAAFDARGHRLDFAWSPAPAACGSLTPAGEAVNFVASPDAGGLTCQLRAVFGGGVGVSTITVAHDVAAPAIEADATSVVETESTALRAFDTFGHAVAFEWATTCGRLSPTAGPETVFVAQTMGGSVCTVSATSGGSSAQLAIDIVHDASEITITPAGGSLTEGAYIDLSAADPFGHGLPVTWTVAPSSCGSMAPALGANARLQTSRDAGGLTCTVTASAYGNEHDVPIVVGHDMGTGTASPDGALVAEAGTLEFTAQDANGHSLVAAWTVSPQACGAFGASAGAHAAFTAAPEAGGLSCTAVATAGSLKVSATLAVRHGAIVRLEVTVGAFEEERGGAASVEAFDVGGHALDAASIAWQSDCGAPSPQSGASVYVGGTAVEGGATCRVTASLGAVTRTVEVHVRHAMPFEVSIESAQAGEGGVPSRTLTAKVTDARGHTLAPDVLTWTSSCGTISGSGATVTFTPPSDGRVCTASASVETGGVAAAGSIEIAAAASAGPSAPLLGGAVAAAAAAAAGVWLVRRRKA